MSNGQFDGHEDHIILKSGTKLAYGMSGFGQSIIEDVVNNYIYLFYNTQLAVRGTWLGYAFLGTRFWDAISDPIMGNISDNTRSRWGRRRPYILLGSVFMSLSFLAMCAPPSGLSEIGHAAYLTVVAFLYFTFYTVTVIPAGGLGTELSLDYHERTRLYAYRGFLGRIGGLIAGSCWLFAGRFPDFRRGFLLVGVTFGVLSFAAFLCVFLGTREDREPQSQEKTPLWEGFRITLQNRAFLMLSGSVFFLLIGVLLGFPAANYLTIYHLYGGNAKAAGNLIFWGNFTFAFTCLLLVAPATVLGVKIGKERAMLVGMALFLLGPLLSWVVFNPAYPYLMLVFQVPIAAGFIFVNIFAGAMVADLVDLDEVQTQKRREGSYSSVLTFVFKLASPVGMMAFSLLQDRWVGFVPGVEVQSAETILRFRLLLLFVPLIPCAIAVLLLLFYPIREDHIREIRELLERRRAGRLMGRESVERPHGNERTDM